MALFLSVFVSAARVVVSRHYVAVNLLGTFHNHFGDAKIGKGTKGSYVILPEIKIQPWEK